MNKRYIASVSWGKDSTAMLLIILEKGLPLDEVVFFDTGKEFEAIYQTRDLVLPLLVEKGVLYTELKPAKSFDFLMFDKPVKTRDGVLKRGYGWCGGPCRWFTTQKVEAIRMYYKSFDVPLVEYVGIAFDELGRFRKLEKWQFAPLVYFQFSEQDCLQFCYSHGINFGYLYRILTRVSCWCCRNKSMYELNNYRKYLPSYFEKLMAIEQRLGVPMKGDTFLKDKFWQDSFIEVDGIWKRKSS